MANTLYNKGRDTEPSFIDLFKTTRCTNGNTELTYLKNKSTRWLTRSSGGRSEEISI
jgi:hypothetical protein